MGFAAPLKSVKSSIHFEMFEAMLFDMNYKSVNFLSVKYFFLWQSVWWWFSITALSAFVVKWNFMCAFKVIFLVVQVLKYTYFELKYFELK